MMYRPPRSCAAVCGFLLAALVLPLPRPAAARFDFHYDPSVVLTEAETTERFSRGAALTESGDAKQGRHAVAWEAPERETAAALSYALDEKQRDRVARAKTLTFWYRFDGKAPPRTFHLKIIAAPLAGGWQAFYPRTVPPVGDWRQAIVPVQMFEDRWGDAPDLSGGSLQFRIGKDASEAVRLVIDDIRVVPLKEGTPVNVGEKKIPAPPPALLVSKAHFERLPDHPRLLFSRPDLPFMKRRTEQTEWGKAYFAALKKRGDERLAQAVSLPDRGGQWYHWYACPKHGTRLRTESPTRHVCPTGGEVYTGYPYDDVVLSGVHDGYAASVRDLGLLYQLTSEKRYAVKAREILLAYADKYLTYPLHDINNKPSIGGGRVGPQTLDESTWLIPMAQGCDAVWDTLSRQDKETLKTKLFYPAVEVIRQHKMGIHNIQCWKNSAVGLVGLLFGDEALVREAIDDPERGMQVQILRGVTEDGPWFEGAWGYHFYTMSALAPLAEAAFRANINVYTGPVGERYKAFYLAPLLLAMPDGKLPAFNDSNTASAMGNAHYEIAFARWNNPRLATPLKSGTRQNPQALVSGIETLPATATGSEQSRNFPDVGYAVLRAGTGADATYLCLKYGPHGGGHGHPDKLNFVLYGGGRILCDDPGTANYGVPIQNGWYKTTLAHNTLVVNEENQKPATGRCLDFQVKDGWSGVLADAGAIYPNVTFRRAVFLIGDDLVVFMDHILVDEIVKKGEDKYINGKSEHDVTFDIVVHPNDALLRPGYKIDYHSEKPGYSYLRDVTVDRRSYPLELRLAPKDKTPAALVFPGVINAPQYILGTGVGKNTEDRVPIVIARHSGVDMSTDGIKLPWVIAVRAAGGAPRVDPFEITEEVVDWFKKRHTRLVPSVSAARITHNGKTYLVVANPEGRDIKVGDEWSGSDRLAVVPLK